MNWLSLAIEPLPRSGQLKAEDADRALETVERNARTQAEIIEDLLDVSRIITGKLNLKIAPVNPVLLVKSAVESLQPAVDAKNLTIKQTARRKNILIIGDAARIQQIIWNLVSNAIKFTPPGGKIKINLKLEGAHLAISVSDTGSGIEPEFLPFVFDRFMQADRTATRSYGGLGLGLAIVRHLVELHGGTVRAESRGLNKGTTFTVKLPVSQAVKQSAKTNGYVSPSGKKKSETKSCDDLSGVKILVVDDEIDSLELIKYFLEQCGAKVAAAKSVSEALNRIDETVPDLLISDIGMQESDGFELIRKVRLLSPERGGKMPAVALTAFAGAEDKMRAINSGFQAHLSKPVDIEELITTLSQITENT